MSEELTQYFEELSVNEDVRLLSKQTDEAMDAAMEQDEALKEQRGIYETGRILYAGGVRTGCVKSLKCFIEFVWLEK